MSNIHVLLLGLGLVITSNTVHESINLDSGMLYCPLNIRCKNLYFNSVDGSLYLNVDMKFNTLDCTGTITLNSKYTDSGTINIPSAKVVSSLGKSFQTISIKVSNSFSTYLSYDNNCYVKYIGTSKSAKLFTFTMKSIAKNEEIHEIDLNNIENEGYIETRSSYPIIKNRNIYYPKEIIDIRECQFDKIINYYYGRFPHEYIRFMYKTDICGSLLNEDYLSMDSTVFTMGTGVILYGGDLFSRYTGITHYASGKARFFEYYDYEYKNGLIYPKFTNKKDIYVLKSGIMKIETASTDLTDKSKLAKEVTYPMDNFNYYYSLAKNMKCTIHIVMGILNKFSLKITFNLNLKEDYYYNHFSQYSIKGIFDNTDLDTNDIYYA